MKVEVSDNPWRDTSPSVCLPPSATLFSFLPPWFHCPFASKNPDFSLSASCWLSPGGFSSNCIMISPSTLPASTFSSMRVRVSRVDRIDRDETVVEEKEGMEAVGEVEKKQGW